MKDTEFTKQILQKSILGLVFQPEQISRLFEKYPPIHVEKGEVIFKEHAATDSLVLLLAGEIELYALSNSKQRAKIGTLIPLRAANVRAFFRNEAYQYSGIAKLDSTILQVPRSEFSDVAALPMEYIALMTESSSHRQISHDLLDLDLNPQFQMAFVTRLRETTWPALSWIFETQSAIHSCFYLLDGSVNAYEKTGDQIQSLFELPKRSWHLFTECIEAQPSPHSYRASTACQVLQLAAEDLRELAEKYPAELAKYRKWMSSGETTTTDLDPDESETALGSFNDLFTDIPQFQGRRRQFPFVRQYNRMDCGPACLAMISSYFGNDLNLPFWRSQVFTNRQGTTLFDIAKGAENNGFVCHGVKVDDISNVENEVLPAIALRDDHYLVVFEIGRKTVTVGDPAFGIEKLSHAEFAKAFTGFMLLLKPTENFFAIKAQTHGRWHYLSLLRGHTKELSLIGFGSVIVVLLSLFPPLIGQIIFDEVLAKRDVRLLLSLLAAGIVVLFSRYVLRWIRWYYLTYLASKFDFRFHSQFMHKLMRLPYPFFAVRHIGDFTRRVSEMERVRQFFSTTVVSILIDLCTLTMYGVVIFIYSPPIALSCLAVAPVLGILGYAFSKKLARAFSETFKSRAEQESLLTDLINGMKTIKTLGAETASRWRFEERLVLTLKKESSFNMTAGTLFILGEAVTEVLRFLIVGYTVYLGIVGQLSTGQVISLAMLVGFVLEPFRNLAQSWSGLVEISMVLERLNDVFMAPEEARSRRQVLAGRSLKGEIEFDNVWFRYGGESTPWVLSGLSFRINSGEHVAIVGPSGSGKSSIALLLARLYEPQRGRILIDGRDYREYDVKWLREQLGYLHQEPNLFDGTIAENIAYSTARFEFSEVMAAAQTAGADEFIAEKQGGYDYKIVYGGSGLSTGEKQRLALARVVYGKPAVLVLDEATSSLDGIAERLLIKSIKKEFARATVINIAHRYSTVLMSDVVIVLSKGRVVGLGRHEDMRKNVDLYSELFDLPQKDAA